MSRNLALQTTSQNTKAWATPPLSTVLKSSGMWGALWVTDAPCSTTESIQESTKGPIDCNLATASLQFPGFGEFQGLSQLFSPLWYTKRRLLREELS